MVIFLACSKHWLMKSSKYDILFANFGHFKILCQDSLHVRLHELILHVRFILMAAVCSNIAAVVTDFDVTAARQNDFVFSKFYTGNLSGWPVCLALLFAW